VKKVGEGQYRCPGCKRVLGVRDFYATTHKGHQCGECRRCHNRRATRDRAKRTVDATATETRRRVEDLRESREDDLS
jgi:hypothetical protein